MLKKYFNSFTAMRYVLPEFIMCASIMILSFIYGRVDWFVLRILIGACSVGVVITIILYFIERYRTGKVLETIHRQSEYGKATVLGFAFFLENRMAAYFKGNVVESDYSNITDARLIVGNKGKQAVELTIDGHVYEAQVSTQQQAERLAAFLRMKNPEIRLHDLKTKGNGSFQSVDLVPAERQMLKRS